MSYPDLYCVGGAAHAFQPTGDAYREWTSANTDTPPPKDATIWERGRCTVCGINYLLRPRSSPIESGKAL